MALGGGVQSVEEGERQAGGGSARAGVRWPHASRPSGARWETVAVRWAGPLEELGQVSGRQVSGWASLFFLYFCSVFYLIATEFKFKQI